MAEYAAFASAVAAHNVRGTACWYYDLAQKVYMDAPEKWDAAKLLYFMSEYAYAAYDAPKKNDGQVVLSLARSTLTSFIGKVAGSKATDVMEQRLMPLRVGVARKSIAELHKAFELKRHVEGIPLGRVWLPYKTITLDGAAGDAVRQELLSWDPLWDKFICSYGRSKVRSPLNKIARFLAHKLGGHWKTIDYLARAAASEMQGKLSGRNTRVCTIRSLEHLLNTCLP